MFKGEGVQAHWASLKPERVAEMREASERVFRCLIGPLEIAHATAIPDGSLVLVSNIGPDGIKVESFSKAHGVQMHRQFSRRDGELVVYHAKMRTTPTGAGKGLRVFATAVARYRDLGVSRIETVASRRDDGDPSKRDNGYHTWARCGFRLVFEETILAKLRKTPWDGARDTHELFHAGGEDAARWWRENGDSCVGEFEVRRDSPHNAYLEAYKRLRGMTDG